MRTVLRLLLVASVLYGTGAHWAALQGAAWVKMAAQGVTAPCDMCRMVEKGQSLAPDLLRAVPSVELAAPAPSVSLVSVAAPSFVVVPEALSAPSLASSVALPPPKLLS